MIALTAAEVARALGGDVHQGYALAPGPGHSDRDRSLKVWIDAHGALHVKSFADDDWQDCIDYVRQTCGLPAFAPDRTRVQPRVDHRQHVNHRIDTTAGAQQAYRLWRESHDPRGTLVEIYLAARGLPLPDEVAGNVIRFHRHCPFKGADGERLFLPAMICRYAPIAGDHDPDAPPSAIHRTALCMDGSDRRRDVAKQMLGPVTGQCVKLTADEHVCLNLNLGEGIESALGCLKGGNWPIWSATTEGIMRRFPLLGGIECLTLFADHDGPGLSAAQGCAERYAAAGREVFIRWPKGLGRDYADEVAP
ncbi:hypothetical protein [Mesorhizobium sp. WSM2561]|uniref:DUF7146 domain-containing protein n=1 Tax=Mesorhizobium sp. WSM2561 TaxID=1040985 RepID=UPI00048A1079|nr:hypothetical protein [Mesorhizobium sp. WSM2561]